MKHVLQKLAKALQLMVVPCVGKFAARNFKVSTRFLPICFGAKSLIHISGIRWLVGVEVFAKQFLNEDSYITC